MNKGRCRHAICQEAKREVASEIFEKLDKYLTDDKLGHFTYRYYKNVIAELKKQYIEPVHCKDCANLMFSDCYGECAKGHKGIVSPNDSCEYGEKKYTEGKE